MTLLLVLSIAQMVLTPFYDTDVRHLRNPSWPAHAKYHCAAYTLLNFGCGALCVALLLINRRAGVPFAAALLAWSSVVQFLACLFPGVTPIAGGEKIIRGLPISLWISMAFLGLVIVGAVAALH